MFEIIRDTVPLWTTTTTVSCLVPLYRNNSRLKELKSCLLINSDTVSNDTPNITGNILQIVVGTGMIIHDQPTD